MTEQQTVDALVADLTAENQHQLLPILADALSDAGMYRQEQGLRIAMSQGKYPTTHPEITETFSARARFWCCAWHYEGYVSDDYQEHLLVTEAHSFLPKDFQCRMAADSGTQWHGRYYVSISNAWEAFLVCCESHLELLNDGHTSG